MMLSPHFSLDELIISQTAARLGIDNNPDTETLSRLSATCAGMEEVRKALGDKPILISSGYRSLALNAAVGGRSTSQHIQGEAVDFTCPAFGTPEQIVRRLIDSNIRFDQVIVEFGSWVHISFSQRNRRHAIVIDRNGVREYA